MLTDPSSQNRSTEDLRALDAAHHFHPFTDHGALQTAERRVIAKADGVYLWDTDGNRLLDGMAGLWCTEVGHGRQEIVEAVRAQMSELSYYNTFFKTAHGPVIELSRVLSELTPPQFNMFFYGSGGSDSNDTIVRMVRTYWDLLGKPEKKTIISRVNAYHGSTVAAASLGGMAGIVFENRAAGGSAAELVRHGEIHHAVFDVGLGIVEPLGRSPVAHHPRCRRLDLHQADLASRSARIRAVIALNRNDGMGKGFGHAVGFGVAGDQFAVRTGGIAQAQTRSLDLAARNRPGGLVRGAGGLAARERKTKQGRRGSREN